jgi:hypothetical protein
MESAAVHPLDLAIRAAQAAASALTRREPTGEIALSLSTVAVELTEASHAAEAACTDPDGRLTYLRSKVQRAAVVYRAFPVDDLDRATTQATLRDVIDSCRRIQRR